MRVLFTSIRTFIESNSLKFQLCLIAFYKLR
jgi:hypothetical protein